MKFAVKRLTRSDLTLFEIQFRRQNAGNQKSINLNRRVFVDRIFPNAPARASGKAAQFPVILRVFGPDGNSDAQQVTRKVIAAGGKQKNWRLNGETIHDPDGQPGRYDDLQDGDYALMGFEGGDVPDAIDVLLLSQDSATDTTVHGELTRILAGKVMVVLSDADLAALAAASPATHPVVELIDAEREEELEEAALGSSEAVRRLRRRSIRRQSAEDLAAARRRAEAVGRDGEVLVAGYLRRRVVEGRISSFTWESEINAINPWDMTMTRLDGSERRIEVKATAGPHSRGIHISQAELEVAIEEGVPRTEIWRISEMDDEGGVLRRSTNFRALARAVRDLCATSGQGLTPDSWTVDPGRLTWTDPRTLRFEDDPEE